MIEIVVVLLYLLVMFLIGAHFKNKAEKTEDFYLSGRSLPWYVVMLTFACTWIGASATMAKSGLAYEVGFSALTPTFATIFAFSIFTFIAPRIRRIGSKYKISSIPDLINRRFGKSAALFAAVIIVWTLIGTIGTQMVAASTILEMICEPWNISYEVALIVSVIVIVIYTRLSGLYGVAYTDVIQGLLLIITLGIIMPIITLNQVGGWSELQAALPDGFFSLKPDKRLIGYMWVYLFYFIAGPPYWQRAFAAKSEKSAIKGVLGANIIILGYTAMITLIGVCAIVLYPSLPYGVSHESLIPFIVRNFYHPIFSAIVIAAIIAVLMSTIDSYLINAAQTIVSDIYKNIKSNVSEKSELRLAKWAIIFLGLAALVFAYNIRIILEALIFAYTFFSSSISIPTLAALYWKKATKAGILSGMVTGFCVSIVWSEILHNPFGLHQSIPGVTICFLTVVIVSLVTYKAEKATPFFE